MELHEIIKEVNIIAGKHGVGRIDHIENRLVGIKSREFYECPAAITLLKAHKDLEDLTFVRELAHFKPVLENELANLIYNGLWFNPATKALIAYLDETQKVVNGIVRIKLYKGLATPIDVSQPILFIVKNWQPTLQLMSLTRQRQLDLLNFGACLLRLMLK